MACPCGRQRMSIRDPAANLAGSNLGAMRAEVAPVARFVIDWRPEVRNSPTCLKSGRYWLARRRASAYQRFRTQCHRGSKTRPAPCRFPADVQRPAVCQDGQHCDTPRTVDSGQLFNRTFVLGLLFFKTFVPTVSIGVRLKLLHYGRSGHAHRLSQDRRSPSDRCHLRRFLRRRWGNGGRCPLQADICPRLRGPRWMMIARDNGNRWHTPVECSHGGVGQAVRRQHEYINGPI